MMLFDQSSILFAAFCSLLITFVSAQSSTVGDNRCGQGYCLTALYDSDKAQIDYTLLVPRSSAQSSTAGWYGIGQGEKMAGANMLVSWVNSDSSVTTSHRTSPSGHKDPQPVTGAAVAGTSTGNVNSSFITINWSLPQTSAPPASMPHIYAMSSKSPASSNPSSTFQMHSYYEQFTLDMTKVNAEQPSPSQAAQAASSSPKTESKAPERDLGDNATRIFIVHMVFMIFAWLVLVPAAVLLARFGRTFFNWFPSHRGIQFATLLFVFIAFFLGVSAMCVQGAKHHFNHLHHKLGLAILILLFVQVALGAVAHHYRAKTGKRWLGFIHAPFGILIFGLAVWNIHEGFQIWKWDTGELPSYIVYGWVGFVSLLYLGGLFLLPREIRAQRAESKALLEKREDGTESPQ